MARLAAIAALSACSTTARQIPFSELNTIDRDATLMAFPMDRNAVHSVVAFDAASRTALRHCLFIFKIGFQPMFFNAGSSLARFGGSDYGNTVVTAIPPGTYVVDTFAMVTVARGQRLIFPGSHGRDAEDAPANAGLAADMATLDRAGFIPARVAAMAAPKFRLHAS